mmetsp:Transcript_30646/g.36101  ORF Transcript_30646/g.36101 Transcript_30646/m.36101 type:complete len:329 (+) Transcript_30646:76-1062(+)
MSESMSGQSICDLKDSKLNRSTDRFDEKLVDNKLKFPVPGLRPTMIDHSVMRLPMSRDPVKKKMTTEKPVRYMTWTGDAGGDFCRPPRASITNGPTSYDMHVENVASVNGIENIFANYFQSGERCQFPEWSRTHWTMNETGNLLAKKDRRKAAFREISAKTVEPGPYWNGFGNVANRPTTGAVISAETIKQSSIHYKPEKNKEGRKEEGLFQTNSSRESFRNKHSERQDGEEAKSSRSYNSYQSHSARSSRGRQSSRLSIGDGGNNGGGSGRFTSNNVITTPFETGRNTTRSSSSRMSDQTGNMATTTPFLASGRSSRRVGTAEASLW